MIEKIINRCDHYYILINKLNIYYIILNIYFVKLILLIINIKIILGNLNKYKFRTKFSVLTYHKSSGRTRFWKE